MYFILNWDNPPSVDGVSGESLRFKLSTDSVFVSNEVFKVNNVQPGSGGNISIDTDNIPEGVDNKYFTNQRVLNSNLTGLNTADTTQVSSLDTVISSVGKVQGQLNLKSNASDTYSKSEIDSKLSSLYRVMPSVQLVTDLPLVGNVVGDARNVIETGDNYVWTDELIWDKLSGVVDLTNYYNKTESDNRYSQLNHIHSYNDLTDLPTISEAPIWTDVTLNTNATQGLSDGSKRLQWTVYNDTLYIKGCFRCTGLDISSFAEIFSIPNSSLAVHGLVQNTANTVNSILKISNNTGFFNISITPNTTQNIVIFTTNQNIPTGKTVTIKNQSMCVATSLI